MRLSTMWETQVRSLGQEDALVKEMATHSSTLAWRIPWLEEPGRLQSMVSQRVRHGWTTTPSPDIINYFTYTCHVLPEIVPIWSFSTFCVMPQKLQTLDYLGFIQRVQIWLPKDAVGIYHLFWLIDWWSLNKWFHVHWFLDSRFMGRFSSVQLLSRVRLFVIPWTAARQASLSITNSRSSLKLTSIELVMPSSHLILCRPLLLLFPIPPSSRVFSNESTLCMRWPKYWSFRISISPSSEHPRLISFRMDWVDLLAVHGTLKSLIQHHSSKASILQHSAFFTVQLLHPYMTTGKTIALTRQTFVGKVMSLLFNMLSRLVITFLPRSKCLLISWLQSSSAVILEPQKIKSDTVFTVSSS